MITRLTGKLEILSLEEAYLTVGPIQLAALISEETRLRLQGHVGEEVTLYTIFDIEGGVGGSRMSPRLIGFQSPVDREFFEIFTSVDGVGVRKALRAMTRSVRDLSRMIQDQDVKGLSTLPGIGEAFAERIVAKLRRKVARFALGAEEGGIGGKSSTAKPGLVSADVVEDAFRALVSSFGHSDAYARRMIDMALAEDRPFADAAELLSAVYQTESKPVAPKKSPKTRKS